MGKSVIFLIILLAVSVRTQTELCPEEDILPCNCYVFNGRPSIECNQIEDEDQLENIFSVDFPESKIQYFTLSDSGIERLSRNVFGHVAFDNVYINTMYLNEIAEDAFKSSSETLINLLIENAPITEYSFPFNSLENYPLLDKLILINNLISEFPTIVSDSLSYLFIRYNIALTNIPSQALVSVPNLKSLEVRHCGIATLAKDAFKGLDQLEYIDLSFNNIVNIPAGLFLYLPSVLEIDLSNNAITDIESGVLSNLPTLKELDLGYNRLQTFNGRQFYSLPELEIINLIANEINYVTPGSFNNLPSLQLIDLGYNRLSRLNTDTFRGVNVAHIYIDSNVINNIEADAFGTVSSSTVNLINNLLTNLYEFWLKPLLDAGNFVQMLDNPIICDCGISWLFSDPTYQENVWFTCENGTDFSDLDPDYYTANC